MWFLVTIQAFGLHNYSMGVNSMIDFKPIELSRKEKSNCTYYELYSMKNQRNIQLYSQQCYYHALVLEMSPSVNSYCERPFTIVTQNNNTLKAKIVDFIVEYTNLGILEIQRMNYNSTNIVPSTVSQVYIYEEKWCTLHGYGYKIVPFDEYKKSIYFIQNIKYLYGLIRRVNSQIYSKYVDLFVCSLRSKEKISISSFMKENNLSAYEALLTVSFGIYRGILSICINAGNISTDTEVQLVSNESSI